MVDKDLTFKFRDEYNRKPIAEKIIRLLESDVDISPLVIDGGWGTGKSEFCHKLINLLESDADSKLRSVYVDAFKADHADEPLMTLLAAVLKLLPEAEQKTLTEKALPAVRFGTKTVLKAGVSWLLKQEATDIADDFEGVLQDASDDAINHSIESILADHVKADESIEALKNALIELTKEEPIVVFVDELDRCRPNFSISMLESIKHIFDVEGVQFVMVVNSEQLRASVNHCYGSGVKAQKYLDKFIGFRLQISNIIDDSLYQPTKVSDQHFLKIIQGSEMFIGSFLDIKKTGVFREVYQLIKVNNLSLREVETFVRYLQIYHTISDCNTLNGESFGYNFLQIIGVYLYCFKPEVFSSESIDIGGVLTAIGQNKEFNIDTDFKSGALSPLEIIGISLVLEDQYENEDRLIEKNREKLEKWKKAVSRLYQGGFGYENDAIETLKGVAVALSLKK